MTGILYLLSLERSGSTPFSFLLSEYEGLVSLGEVQRTLRFMARPEEFPVAHCSCGQRTADCPIWGEIHHHRADLRRLDIPQQYQRLLDVVARARGNDSVIVDSSKELGTLQTLSASPVAPALTAVFLVKDVRGYLHSILKRTGALPETRMLPKRFQNTVPGILFRLVPTSLLYALRWRRANLRMHRFLTGSRLPWLRLGYEEVFLDAAPARARLDAFLGNRPHDGANTDHHVLLGNFPFLAAESKQLKYDAGWLHSDQLGLFGWLSALSLARLNRKLVYGR